MSYGVASCEGPDCDNDFEKASHNQKYCSSDCKRNQKKANRRRQFTEDVAKAVAPLYQDLDEEDLHGHLEFLRKEVQRLSRALDKEKSRTTEIIDAVFHAAQQAMEDLELPSLPKKRKKRYSPEGEWAVSCIADVQLGKAIEDSVPVLTTVGWKQHGDLRPGDFVYSPEGKPVKILSVTGSTLQLCYRILFDDQSEIIASEDHLWNGYRSYKSYPDNIYHRRPLLWSTRQISQIPRRQKTGQYNTWHNDRSFHIRLPQPLYFPHKDLPIDPFVFGLYLGDGSTGDGRIAGSLEDLLEKVNLGRINEYDYGCPRLTIPGLKSQLKRLEMKEEKYIPEDYLFSSIEQRLELIRGLMDSDGTIEKEYGVCTFDNTNSNLIETLIFVLESLGIKTTQSQRVGKLNGEDKKICYRAFFRPVNQEVFNLSRKLERQKDISVDNQSNFKFVQSAVEVGERSAQCITVEGGLYLVGKKLIPTHNCTPSYNSEIAAQRVALYGDKVCDITDILRSNHEVNNCAVWFLGDIVEGEDIFPSQSHQIDSGLYSQVGVNGPNIFAPYLLKMLDHFEHVRVAGVIGNHGSIRGPRSSYNPETNMDRLLYRILELMFRNEDRITFNIPHEANERSFYAVETIGQYKALLVHGDQFPAPNSIHPYYKKVMGWKDGAIPEDFQDVFMGHFHHNVKMTIGSTTLRIVGSTESTNTFAQELLAAMCRPSQLLVFVDPDIGSVTSEWTVHLDEI